MSQRSCQRQYYRIKYPESDRPRLRTATGEYEIFDCSEAGVCYRVSSGPLPELGSSVSGRIRFAVGETADITGTVLRLDGELVAIKLTTQIPFWLVLEEQRRLRDRFVGQAKATGDAAPAATPRP